MEYLVHGEFAYKKSDVSGTFGAWWVPLRSHISHGGGALRLPWLGYGAKRRTLYLGIGRRPIPHCTFYLGMTRGPIPSCTLHLGMSLQPIPRYKVCKGRAY